MNCSTYYLYLFVKGWRGFWGGYHVSKLFKILSQGGTRPPRPLRGGGGAKFDCLIHSMNGISILVEYMKIQNLLLKQIVNLELGGAFAPPTPLKIAKYPKISKKYVNNKKVKLFTNTHLYLLLRGWEHFWVCCHVLL